MVFAMVALFGFGGLVEINCIVLRGSFAYVVSGKQINKDI